MQHLPLVTPPSSTYPPWWVGEGWVGLELYRIYPVPSKLCATMLIKWLLIMALTCVTAQPQPRVCIVQQTRVTDTVNPYIQLTYSTSMQ